VRVRVATLIWRDGYGGAERSVRDLAAALDRDQFDMRCYFLAGPRGSFAEEIADLGNVVENLHWRNGFSLAGRWRLLQALHLFDPMIVHDHNIPLLTRPLVKLACRCPVLHTEHGVAMRHAAGQDSWRRLIARFDLRFCDRVLANSYASQEAVRRAYQLSESKIQVLYLGIDLQRFASVGNLATGRRRLRIGFVGRLLNMHKGTDYLPRVARLLSDMGYHDTEFVVVGDGPDRLAVESLCRQMKVTHLFRFLGFRSDVQSLLSTFDVMLVPSRFESFGLSALEALAMGVRVVGFDVGGLSEAVGECDAAYLVSPGDVEAMAQAIADILDLPHIRSRSSRTYVEARFSSQRMASDVQQVYREYAF
jgi:glycosyltransferase involved in cell wall biosynthesis